MLFYFSHWLIIGRQTLIDFELLRYCLIGFKKQAIQNLYRSGLEKKVIFVHRFTHKKYDLLS
jgi:hypothetical protein